MPPLDICCSDNWCVTIVTLTIFDVSVHLLLYFLPVPFYLTENKTRDCCYWLDFIGRLKKNMWICWYDIFGLFDENYIFRVFWHILHIFGERSEPKIFFWDFLRFLTHFDYFLNYRNVQATLLFTFSKQNITKQHFEAKCLSFTSGYLISIQGTTSGLVS